MKISQMTTNQAADALVKISAHASNILDDPDMMEIVKDTAKTGKKDSTNGWSKILTKLIPCCLQKHREDLFAIIAALDDKTIEQVGDMKLIDTLNILKESVDKELLDFFDSFKTARITELK